MLVEETSSIDFSQPSRQSPVAILQIIYKTYVVIVRQLWPFLIVLLVGGGQSSFSTKVSIAIGVTAVVSMIVSILRYIRYRYSIVDGELVIEQGILQRSRISLPADRIQTINIEQNLVHRLTKVVRLKIDTAGSAGQEINISAISHERASAMQDVLLARRSASVTIQQDDSIDDVQSELPQDKTVHKVGISELLLIGITQNHLRSGWFIILFLFWIMQNLNDAGVDVDDYLPTVTEILVFSLYIGIGFVVLSLLISLVRSVVQYYDLSFVRVGSDGFRLESGLFTRRSVSAQDSKIQVITWSDNLLRKMAGIFDMSIKQAGPRAINVKKSIRVAGINTQGISAVSTMLYGRDVATSVELQGVDYRWLLRRLIIWSFLCIAIATAGYLYGDPKVIVAMAVLLIYIYWSRYRAYRKLAFGMDADHLVIRGGIWGDSCTIIPVYKLQGVALTSSIYQRRHDLTDVVLHTAAGKYRIPYIDQDTASNLADQCLYYVETSTRPWM